MQKFDTGGQYFTEVSQEHQLVSFLSPTLAWQAGVTLVHTEEDTSQGSQTHKQHCSEVSSVRNKHERVLKEMQCNTTTGLNMYTDNFAASSSWSDVSLFHHLLHH